MSGLTAHRGNFSNTPSQINVFLSLCKEQRRQSAGGVFEKTTLLVGTAILHPV